MGVSVSPPVIALIQSQTQQFTASVTGSANTGVTWSLSPAIGSITAAGLYTAPASIASSQTVTVKATSVADPTKSATATVTLNPPVSVTMSPASVNLTQSQTQQFSATVTNTGNSRRHLVAQPAGRQYHRRRPVHCAGLDHQFADRHRESHQRGRSHEIRHRHRDAHSSSDSLANAIFSVFATVTKPNIYGYGQRHEQHRGHLVDQPGFGKLGERCDDCSLRCSKYCPDYQSVTITATSMADPSKTATAVITLLQAVTVSLSPSTVSLAPSGTQQFTATVLGTSNTAVTWSINPSVGTISSAGLYTAPSSILTSQTVTVTAQSVADPTKSASAQVSLSASSLNMVTFSATADALLNPERGYAQGWDILAWDPVGERANGRSIIRGFVSLAHYLTVPLDQTLLNSLDTGLARVRAAHLKTTLRFKYNDGETYPYCPVASKSLILQHIASLAPILVKYEDIILSQELGFLGCWGESDMATGQDVNEERDIVTALLNALPSRFVQLRSPTDKAAMFSFPTPMTAAEAFTPADRSRVGHYNDCILRTNDGQDFTYPSGAIAFWTNYVTTETNWTPMGGETCGDQAVRSYCTSAGGQAQNVMSQYHFSYLNWEGPVLTDWQTQGCYDEIGNNLGYRLVLNTASYSSATTVGGSLHLNVNLTNHGYSAPFNSRPVYAVIDGNGQRYEQLLSGLDPRFWGAGQTLSFSVDIPLPTVITAGTYRLSLWLPDPAVNLRTDALYSIRMANQGIWDATNGFNVITQTLFISTH